MKILIFGGDGMLGHQLLKSWQHKHQVFVTLRRPLAAYAHYGLFNTSNSIVDVDVNDLISVERAIQSIKADAVINAVGIIKQRDAAHNAISSISINSLFPHQLHLLCQQYGSRLVHLSTDCVFSGRQGLYSENDNEDARDLYGRSKLLGEVTGQGAITLRTSIIGLELARKQSLIEWFLAQTGTIKGFNRAIYSGFTTLEMARIIERVLIKHQNLHGLYHVASKPISKYDLLNKLSNRLEDLDINIESNDDFVCDRSLDGTSFCNKTAYITPSWNVMLDELAAQIRKH
ncbi:MAG: SDR family oxidoreductase [Mariprofundales bacterium]